MSKKERELFTRMLVLIGELVSCDAFGKRTRMMEIHQLARELEKLEE